MPGSRDDPSGKRRDHEESAWFGILMTALLVVVLAGVVVYAFLKAYRERTGQVPAPVDNPPLEPFTGR